MSKGTRSIFEFLTRVRIIVDTLMSIGDPVLHCDQIELIFEAFSTEFDSVFAVVNSRLPFVSLNELELLHLTREACIQKTKKEVYETFM